MEEQEIQQPQPNEQQLQPIVPQGQLTPYDQALQHRAYMALLVAKLRGLA